MIAAGVRHLTFVRTDGEMADFIPGQFINLHFEWNGEMLQRSYSIASIHGQSIGYEIAISHVEGGKATDFLFHMQPGATVEASGPFGRLVMRDEHPSRYIFIATGTGVTPYRAMLPEMEKCIQHKGIHIELLLGVRNPDELLYGKEFIAFAEKHPLFKFHACYSRQMPEKPESYEYHGHVHPVVKALNLDPTNDVVYLCGNPLMIDEAFNYLKELGFDNKNVRREKYVFSH
jgi:ferredoxin-NADP reductase